MDFSHVPRGSLGRANDSGSAYVLQSKEGARHTYFYSGVYSLTANEHLFSFSNSLSFKELERVPYGIIKGLLKIKL